MENAWTRRSILWLPDGENLAQDKFNPGCQMNLGMLLESSTIATGMRRFAIFPFSIWSFSCQFAHTTASAK